MIPIENQMMGNSFGIRFDGKQVPVPQEIRDIQDLKWEETVFISEDYHKLFVVEGRYVELSVTEQGVLYREAYLHEIELSEKDGMKLSEKNMELTALDNFTGEINFGHFMPMTEGEEDYYFFYKATFHNGVFEKIEAEPVKKLNKKLRSNLTEKINEQVKRQVKLMNNPLYRWLYVPYKIILTFVVLILEWILMLPIRLLNFLYGILTPL